MAAFAFFIGAFLITALVMGIIYQHRKKRGDDRLAPPAIYAAWVALAIYGAGTREDYSMSEAALYPIAAALAYSLAFAKRHFLPKKAAS